MGTCIEPGYSHSQDSAETIAGNGKGFAEQHNVECGNENCRTCELRFFCGGGCRACSLSEGDIHALDPYCEFYKHSLLEYMSQLKL